MNSLASKVALFAAWPFFAAFLLFSVCVVLVVHLWDFDAVDCAMCGTVTRHRFSVPWCCGPVAEGENDGGHKCVCEPCHDRWAAWNDSLRYYGA